MTSSTSESQRCEHSREVFQREVTVFSALPCECSCTTTTKSSTKSRASSIVTDTSSATTGGRTMYPVAERERSEEILLQFGAMVSIYTGAHLQQFVLEGVTALALQPTEVFGCWCCWCCCC